MERSCSRPRLDWCCSVYCRRAHGANRRDLDDVFRQLRQTCRRYSLCRIRLHRFFRDLGDLRRDQICSSISVVSTPCFCGGKWERLNSSVSCSFCQYFNSCHAGCVLPSLTSTEQVVTMFYYMTNIVWPTMMYVQAQISLSLSVLESLMIEQTSLLDQNLPRRCPPVSPCQSCTGFGRYVSDVFWINNQTLETDFDYLRIHDGLFRCSLGNGYSRPQGNDDCIRCPQSAGFWLGSVRNNSLHTAWGELPCDRTAG
jgi:hypothetical protein